MSKTKDNNMIINPRPQYQSVIEKWLNMPTTEANATLKSILQRGIWCCNNKANESCNGILISGINPSFDEKHPEEPADCSFWETVNANGSDYWQTKKNMVVGLGLPVAYIDLFPLRMTKQDGFMNDKNVPLELKAELLRITQNSIEEICPKLIINTNMGSRVYWGLIDKYSWMGYDMEPVKNIIDKGDLYRIKGIKSKEDVLQHGFQSKLPESNTFFLQYKYHGNGVLRQEQYLNSNDIKLLWDYINNL